MTPRPYQHLSGEALRKARRAADNELAWHLARLRGHDELFRQALDKTLELDEEADTRRNT
jgi:hypothetical protein